MNWLRTDVLTGTPHAKGDVTSHVVSNHVSQQQQADELRQINVCGMRARAPVSRTLNASHIPYNTKPTTIKSEQQLATNRNRLLGELENLNTGNSRSTRLGTRKRNKLAVSSRNGDAPTMASTTS